MEDPRVASPSSLSADNYISAMLNILDDFSAEKRRLESTQKAILNIMEDFGDEKTRLEATQRAVLNILEDAGAERRRLEEMQKAVFNILDDLEAEKTRLQNTQQDLVASERAIRLSLHEKEVLLKEVHHRVKNNLQIISSLLSLQARYFTDQPAREIFAESQHRVQSIALVHEKLYRSSNLAAIDFGDYLGTLARNLFDALDGQRRGIKLDLDVVDVPLAIDIAVPCGLIVNELLTNSLKHAFPRDRTGTIRVGLRNLSTDQFVLVVADDGIGLPKDLNLRRTRSLGLELVYTFADQLGAKTEVKGEIGTLYRFKFSVSKEA